MLEFGPLGSAPGREGLDSGNLGSGGSAGWEESIDLDWLTGGRCSFLRINIVCIRVRVSLIMCHVRHLACYIVFPFYLQFSYYLHRLGISPYSYHSRKIPKTLIPISKIKDRKKRKKKKTLSRHPYHNTITMRFFPPS